jgi:hypothetical protein
MSDYPFIDKCSKFAVDIDQRIDEFLSLAKDNELVLRSALIQGTSAFEMIVKMLLSDSIQALTTFDNTSIKDFVMSSLKKDDKDEFITDLLLNGSASALIKFRDNFLQKSLLKAQDFKELLNDLKVIDSSKIGREDLFAKNDGYVTKLNKIFQRRNNIAHKFDVTENVSNLVFSVIDESTTRDYLQILAEVRDTLIKKVEKRLQDVGYTYT